MKGYVSGQENDCYRNESPSHYVKISDFFITKYEVTQGLWKAVMGNNPSYFSGNDYYPVESVSWNDIVGTSGDTMVIKGVIYYANGFIYKLNQLTGKQYRLPTEAEWEYAAGGGNKNKGHKYSGSNRVGDVAWYLGNSDNKSHAVGRKSPNELDIYDMSGNVWEWCSDWYGKYINKTQDNPTGPNSGNNKVARGGGWYYNAWNARVFNRNYFDPDFRGSSLGFRLAHSSN